jgi:beta-phosphoglucomutase
VRTSKSVVIVIATLLDFDGVLVDSEPVHLAAFNDVLASNGIAIDEQEYAERYLSLDDAGVFRSVLSQRGRTLREEEVRSLVAAKSPRFMERFQAAFRVFPGARELIARRAARGPVAIVSGALEGEIAYALSKLGAEGHIAFIVSAEHAHASKPDPAPFLVALERLRNLGHAGASVVVEDSIGGVQSAKSAGLRCLAVTHTCASDELRAAGADVIVGDLASLTDELFEGAA